MYSHFLLDIYAFSRLPPWSLFSSLAHAILFVSFFHQFTNGINFRDGIRFFAGMKGYKISTTLITFYSYHRPFTTEIHPLFFYTELGE